MDKTLYELLGMKAKRSIYKSALITDEYLEGARIIEVEPFDQTGVNIIDGCLSVRDKGIDRIEKKLLKYFKRTSDRLLRICIYSNVYSPFEYLLDIKTGKTY